ncbi:hypothetical protein Ancab_038493 [Ancistrocladus abbreviatus]
MNEYIGHDATLLVIVPAVQAPDVASSQALKVAKEYDRDGTRTIGMVCKIDQASSDQKALAAVQALLLDRGPRTASDIPWFGFIDSENSSETAWTAESESLASTLVGAPKSKLGRVALLDLLALQIRKRMKLRLPTLLSGPEGSSLATILTFQAQVGKRAEKPEPTDLLATLNDAGLEQPVLSRLCFLPSAASAQSITRIEDLLQEDQNMKRQREHYQRQSSLLAKLSRQLSIHDNHAAAASNWTDSGSVADLHLTQQPMGLVNYPDLYQLVTAKPPAQNGFVSPRSKSTGRRIPYQVPPAPPSHNQL